jgi:bacteriocin-like protein
MKKSILELEGVQKLTKDELKTVNGGVCFYTSYGMLRCYIN